MAAPTVAVAGTGTAVRTALPAPSAATGEDSQLEPAPRPVTDEPSGRLTAVTSMVEFGLRVAGDGDGRSDGELGDDGAVLEPVTVIV